MSLLPPNSTKLERALEAASARLEGVPVPLRQLWNPATCPLALLPWLAWGLSVDFWDSDWSEAEKRSAIASAIADQKRKGTRTSLRAVLDRFDPLITLVEWFEDKASLPPHTFRLELPLSIESDVDYDADLIAALLRDIAAVKPLRSHMTAVHKMVAQANAGLIGGAATAGIARISPAADMTAALDLAWDTYLQTENGEPLENETGTAFLEEE